MFENHPKSLIASEASNFSQAVILLLLNQKMLL